MAANNNTPPSLNSELQDEIEAALKVINIAHRDLGHILMVMSNLPDEQITRFIEKAQKGKEYCKGLYKLFAQLEKSATQLKGLRDHQRHEQLRMAGIRTQIQDSLPFSSPSQKKVAFEKAIRVGDLQTINKLAPHM